jgi:hypothetical protein
LRGFDMKTKIFLLAMVLTLALSALVTAQTNYGISNSASATPLPPQNTQVAQVAQSSMLNASNATSGVTGTIGAAAGDITRYFNNNSATTISSSDRDVVTRRANDVLRGYSTSNFVMSMADFDNAVSQMSANLYIIDVGAAGNRNIANANMIGISDLPNRISGIPAGRTVAVFADNDVDGAVAVTLLRLEGYNAYLVSSGAIGALGGTTGITSTSESSTGSENPLPPQNSSVV